MTCIFPKDMLKAFSKYLLLIIIFITLLFEPLTANASNPQQQSPKVVIVSMPRVTWSMLEDIRIPNIDNLIENGSSGSLSILTPGGAKSLENGYVTIAAGNRAGAAPAQDTTFFMRNEEVNNQLSQNIFRDERGQVPGNGEAFALGYEKTIVENSRGLYKPDIGAFTSALEAGNKTISVIGNADMCTRQIMGCSQRAIAYLGSDRNGVVKNGDISRDLLNDDLSLNMKLVEEKTLTSIKEHDVSAVECSNIEKADNDRSSSVAMVSDELIKQSIMDCDKLIGKITEKLDLNKDRIFIVSPASPRTKEQLTVFISAGKGISPGYAISGITRRKGIVSLADIAPTILDFYNIETPNTMEATLLDWVKSSETVTQKKESFIDVNKKSTLRDSAFVKVAATFILVIFLSVILSLSAYKKFKKLKIYAVFLSWMSLVMPTIAFLMAPFMLALSKPIIVYLFFVSSSILVSVGCYFAMKKYGTSMVVLWICATTLTVQIVDIIFSGNLQLNSLFGYSAIIAGRFAGFGNLAFSIVAISSVVLVAMIKQLSRTRPYLNKKWVNIAILAMLIFVLIMDGLPYLGSDVGGVLSLTPMVFIVGLMMYEKRLSIKTIIYALLITLATLTAFSLFDLSRPLSERTHLGRFVKVVLNGEGRTIIERKILSNLHILTNSLTATVVIIATIFLIFLFLKPEKFVKEMSLLNPGFRYIVYPGLVVGLLGMLLNDSGVAIPGMMLSIAAPTIALLSFENLSKVELDADLSDKTV
jgi:hypothetical protein